MTRALFRSLSCTGATASLALAGFMPMSLAGAASALLTPSAVIADRDAPGVESAPQVLAARRYATFWNTGDPDLARAALAPKFIDRTLPAGRPQGVEGALLASRVVREALPDLACSIEQMIVAGDRVVVHLRFHGHFTGTFRKTKGHGETIDFIATDIYHVVDGRIAENWHIEDNLTLLQQLGLISN